MHTLFRLANPEYTGKPAATVPEFLQLGTRFLPTFVTNETDLRAARLSLAESMFDSGDLTDALPVLQQVIDSSRTAGDHASEAEAESLAGNIEYSTGKSGEGKALSEHALALSHDPGITPSARIRIETLYTENLENAGYKTPQNLQLMRDAVAEARSSHVPEHELADALMGLSDKLNPRGGLEEAEATLNEAIAIYSRESYALCDQSKALGDLALLRNQRKDNIGSRALMQRSYAGYVACAGEGSRSALEAQSYLAASMLSTGGARDAEPLLEGSLPKWKALVGPDSDELATPLLFLARAQLLNKEFDKAETTARELVRVQTGKINPQSAQMGVCELVLAQALAGESRYREALLPATLADGAFTREGSKSAGTQRNAATAHALLLDLQGRLGPASSGASAPAPASK